MQLQVGFSLLQDSFVLFSGVNSQHPSHLARDNTSPLESLYGHTHTQRRARAGPIDLLPRRNQSQASRQQRYFWALVGGRNAGLRFRHGPLDHQYHPRPVSLVVHDGVTASSIEPRSHPPLTNQPVRDGTDAKPPCRLVLCATTHLQTQGLHLGRHHDGGGVSDGEPGVLKKTCAVLCRTLAMAGKP